MNDLLVHALLFAFVGVAIVVLGSFFGDMSDKAALANVPRRLAVFFAGCALVAALLLLIEHTVASVG